MEGDKIITPPPARSALAQPLGRREGVPPRRLIPGDVRERGGGWARFVVYSSPGWILGENGSDRKDRGRGWTVGRGAQSHYGRDVRAGSAQCSPVWWERLHRGCGSPFFFLAASAISRALEENESFLVFSSPFFPNTTQIAADVRGADLRSQPRTDPFCGVGALPPTLRTAPHDNRTWSSEASSSITRTTKKQL